MMNEAISPALRQASEEIEAILKKNNIMASIVLADGKGHGEFIFNLEDPTWSSFESEGKGRLRLRSKAKVGTPEEHDLQRTVNACFVMYDLMMSHTRALHSFVTQIGQQATVIRDENAKTYDREGHVIQ